VPPGAEVRVDGRPVGTAELEVTVVAGPHRVQATHENHDPLEVSVDVKPQERLEVDLKMPPRTSHAPPLPPEPKVSWWNTRRIAGVAMMAAGLAGVLVGAPLLAIDGSCHGDNCPQFWDNKGSGGALVGLGAALVVAGGVGDSHVAPAAHARHAGSAWSGPAPSGWSGRCGFEARRLGFGSGGAGRGGRFCILGVVPGGQRRVLRRAAFEVSEQPDLQCGAFPLRVRHRRGVDAGEDLSMADFAGIDFGGPDFADMARECNTTSQCTDPARPICNTGPGQCRACVGTDDSQCALHSGDNYCDVGSGRCVECTPATQATICPSTKPICEHGHVPHLQQHSECSTGVCKDNGTCAASNEVFYVDNGNQLVVTCKAGGTHDGAMGTPFCDIQDAVGARQYIKVTGHAGFSYGEVSVDLEQLRHYRPGRRSQRR